MESAIDQQSLPYNSHLIGDQITDQIVDLLLIVLKKIEGSDHRSDD